MKDNKIQKKLSEKVESKWYPETWNPVFVKEIRHLFHDSVSHISYILIAVLGMIQIIPFFYGLELIAVRRPSVYFIYYSFCLLIAFLPAFSIAGTWIEERNEDYMPYHSTGLNPLSVLCGKFAAMLSACFIGFLETGLLCCVSVILYLRYTNALKDHFFVQLFPNYGTFLVGAVLFLFFGCVYACALSVFSRSLNVKRSISMIGFGILVFLFISQFVFTYANPGDCVMVSSFSHVFTKNSRSLFYLLTACSIYGFLCCVSGVQPCMKERHFYLKISGLLLVIPYAFLLYAEEIERAIIFGTKESNMDLLWAVLLFGQLTLYAAWSAFIGMFEPLHPTARMLADRQKMPFGKRILFQLFGTGMLQEYLFAGVLYSASAFLSAILFLPSTMTDSNKLMTMGFHSVMGYMIFYCGVSVLLHKWKPEWHPFSIFTGLLIQNILIHVLLKASFLMKSEWIFSPAYIFDQKGQNIFTGFYLAAIGIFCALLTVFLDRRLQSREFAEKQ